MSILTSKVKFDNKRETYVHVDSDTPFHRVSNVIKSFEPPFPKIVIATAIANRDKITVEEVLEDWEKRKNDAIARGNIIHKAIEEYEEKQLVTDINLKDFVIKMHTEFADYIESYNEVTLHSNEFVIAGTADKVAFRTKKIVDVYDYKTNIARGIEFFNKYNKYLNAPLDHLMDCNYNTYALQLSTYAYMLENTFKCKIGRICIIYIPPSNPMKYIKIPIPYLKSEVALMLRTYAENNALEPIVEVENWS